ncbi:hypothetical protein XENTR_v10009441 [Xenopus tropicalis]|uniref:Rab11 family-interacting protein 2 n=2 Tax=Xenopus tropicalis TaxID=8364 RepID=A0A8J0SA14_XENTR|nr:rab11 family-interacting protein 1 [Xenopus tropicalis]KAE8618659.1 hypothetical protein XENTR_v10009441 [Xenopus tropicalis]
MSLAQQSQTWFPTHVQVTVLQAKGLKPKGKAGSNDAYAIIQLGKEKYSTTVAEKSQAPVWKEEATFEVPLLHNDNQERCTVRVIVMHRALVGMDKFLGQLELNLWELHQSRNRRKVQWYPLRSKPGKKEKERGQIEVEVQFMRNNMTASMFDLSMKEKSRSTLGKLRDKIKGKKHEGFPDTASAIVPSMNQYDSDEDMPAAEKKKSKLKNLFSKPGLKKNSISQSMSVLPTFPPSSSPKTVLRPAEFSSDFTPPTGSPASERRFPHLPVIMTHKRTVSADTSQLSSNKKEGLSLFSGMKPKNDPITRSNLCINGNHVYMEESETRSESPKDSSQTNSPQIVRKNPLYASAENLSSKTPKEAKNSLFPEKEQTPAASNDSLKSSTVSASQNSKSEEPISKTPPLPSDVPKEAKDNKKQENKKSSLLSLVTGKKDTPKVPENESSVAPLKGDMSKATGDNKKIEQSSINVTKKTSLNPFEDDMEEEKKPEPLPTSAKTSAVKPRLDVSSEAETKAKLSSSSLSNSAASISGGQDGVPTSLPDFPTASNAPSSPLEHYLSLQCDNKVETPVESYTDYETPSVPLFWRSGLSQSKQPEPREVHVVEPFNEKTKERKTYVKSLLDQLTRKSPTNSVADADTVDVDLVKGVFPIQDSSPFDDIPHTDTDSLESEKSDVQLTKTLKETPKPAPRTQSAPKKQEPKDEIKPVPPKPAPRSATKVNKAADDSAPASSTPPEKALDTYSNQELQQASNVGSSLNSGQAITEVKMATPKISEYSLRLDELPVIPENPEGTSDDEQLETKDDIFSSHSSNKSSSAAATRETNPHLSVQKNSLPKTNDEVDFALEQKNEKNRNPECVDKINASDAIKISTVSLESQGSDKANHYTPINSSLGYSSPTPASLPTDKCTTPSADPPTKPAIEGTDKVDSSGKKKLLRAWVSPSETHPIPTVQSGGTVSSRIRTNPVKPMSATQTKTVSGFSQPIKSHDVAIKKYDPTDPAAAYSQLTHDELIQLVLKQKDIISKKEVQMRELEDYIDNLLVRIMEETPSLLQSINKKMGKW